MNIVIFASDAKGLSSLNSIINDSVNFGLNIYAIVTNSTTLKHPAFNKDNFDILTNVEEGEKRYFSSSLGQHLPFKPDWLLIARERWEPEQSIIQEFKSKFNCKIGLVEPNSWILGNYEGRLETLSRNRFKDLIDVFFTHSEHSKEVQKSLGFEGNMVVTGNPKYDLNLKPDSNTLNQLSSYYKVDPNKKQVLLFSLINSNRDKIKDYFKSYIKDNPNYQFFYKPYPGEPFDQKFRNDFYPDFFLENCTPILEENHVWSILNICDIHIGCISSIIHSTLLLNKQYIDLSKELNIQEQYKDIEGFFQENGVGIENNIRMWMNTFNLQNSEQLRELLKVENLDSINSKVWDNLDSPENLLILFDQYNDNQSSNRILNYIVNGNIQ